MTLQDLFKNIRRYTGLSQQQLADALNLTIKSVSSIESGKTNNIKSSTQEAIAKYLGVSKLLLMKVLNDEADLEWGEDGNIKLTDSEEDSLVYRYVNADDKTYNLFARSDMKNTFYFTTSKRDHRNIILLIPYSEFMGKGNNSNEALIGSLLARGTLAKEDNAFRSICIIFEATKQHEYDSYYLFKKAHKISLSSVNIEYVLFDLTHNKVIDRTKMTI